MDGQSPHRWSKAPRCPARGIERRALLERLDGALGTGLICVQAPAGYGKTALLAAFAEQAEYNIAWVNLDTGCVSVEVLVDRLGAALAGEGVQPDFVPSGNPSDAKAYLARMIGQAADSPDFPLMIVLDNWHELGPSEEALDLLDWMVSGLAEGVEIVLSGRPSPQSTREVDKRLASGESTLITARDLAFTEAEVAEFALLNDSAVPLERLMAETNGWPIGVAALVKGSVLLKAPAGSSTGAVWDRYMVRELWGAVPERLRPVFRVLSVPDRFDPQLAEALAGADGAAAFHEWVTTHDFLVSIDGEEHTLLNPMVRRFVRERFRREARAEFAAVADEVVGWLAARRQFLPAMELALTLSDSDTLLHFLERHALDVFYQRRFAALERALAALPDEARRDHPLLAALYARIAAHLGQPAVAIERAAALVPDVGLENAAAVHVQIARVKAYRLLGKTHEMNVALARLLRLPIDPEKEPLLAAEVAYVDAEKQAMLDGDKQLAEQRLSEAASLAALGGSTALQELANSTLGLSLLARGDGPAAVNTLTNAITIWRSGGGSANIGWVLNNLGMAHLLAGDHEQALAALAEAKAVAITSENPRSKAYATASMGDAHLVRGDYQAAREAYEEAVAYCATEVSDEGLSAFSIAGLAAAFLGLGDLQEADYFIRRAVLIAEVVGTGYELGYCRLHEAAIRLATGEAADAVRLAQEAVHLLDSAGAQSGVRMGQYRLAQCMFRLGRRQQAVEALDQLHRIAGEAWMLRGLEQLIHEDPMFAQWAATRPSAPAAFSKIVSAAAFKGRELAAAAKTLFPVVAARSLGAVNVSVNGGDVPEKQWASARAKEMFFLFMANRDGVRKEEAVEHLYPDIEADKSNSAFHSNLHRMRRALYKECVVKHGSSYRLQPNGLFEWDVDEFQAAVQAAQQQPAGSESRAQALRQAVAAYSGPFAAEFHSEWAETLRMRVKDQADSALVTLAGFYAAREEYESAASCITQMLDRDDLNEEAAYLLVVYRARAGQPAAALSFIDDYQQVYARQYDDELPGRFAALRSRIASGLAV